MKAIPIFFLGLFCSLAIHAQIYNANFEEWPDSLVASSHEEDLKNLGVENILRGIPAGWELSHFPFGVCRSTDACEGNFALLLFAWYHGVETGVQKTFPISYRPASLEGCYKYLFFDDSLDQAVCYIDLVFSKGEETLATARFDFDTISTYRHFELPITYSSASVPDSVSIRIYSSVLSSPNFPADGLLFLDDLKLEDTTTGTQNALQTDHFKVYPNPFANSFFIDCQQAGDFHYELYNLKGELLQKDSLHQMSNSLTVAHLPAGVYILNIVGGQEQRLVQKFIKN